MFQSSHDAGRRILSLIEVTIPLRSHDEAILVLGPYDRNAKLLRQALDIEIFTRGGNLRLRGLDDEVTEAQRRIEHLLGKFRKGRPLEAAEIEEILIGDLAPERGDPRRASGIGGGDPRRASGNGGGDPRRASGNGGGDPRRASGNGGGDPRRASGNGNGNGAEKIAATNTAARAAAQAKSASVLSQSLRLRAVEARSPGQRRYLEAIEASALTFGVGVAGTGKTYLAVAAAVRALRAGTCRRLVITRPVVEAGEHLGFLPGDVQAKLNPYMRPVYDALFEIVGFEDVSRLEEIGVIEVAPLAYMRGRTLSSAFVILDEAQNTTVAQMKMFLTRLGEGSTMVVTGDPTQSDLDPLKPSGFMDAVRRLRGYSGVVVVEFTAQDIVRHPLVAQILKAYDAPPPATREARGEAKA